MRLKKWMLVFVAVAAFALPLRPLTAAERALSKNEKKALAIFKEMKKVSYSYRKTLTLKNGKMISYLKRYKDGVVKQRIENIFTNPRTGFVTKDAAIRDGVNIWNVFDDVAIKDNVTKKKQERAAKNTHNNDESSISYHVTNTVYKGIPCYKVTCRFKHRIQEAKKWYPGVNILWIGKKNFYNYRTEMYDANGKLIADMDNSNVEFLDDISDDLFKIPDNCKIYVAETFPCWLKLRAIAMDAQACDDPKLAKRAKKDFKSLYGTDNVESALKAACDKYNSQKEEEDK